MTISITLSFLQFQFAIHEKNMSTVPFTSSDRYLRDASADFGDHTRKIVTWNGHTPCETQVQAMEMRSPVQVQQLGSLRAAATLSRAL